MTERDLAVGWLYARELGRKMTFLGTLTKAEWDYVMTGEERPDPLAPPEGYGVKPGAEPEQAEDSATCVHHVCQETSLWRFFWGDGAEHIARLNLCAQHAMVFWLKQQGGIVCSKCGQPMTLIRIESMRDGTDWPLHVPEDLPPFPQDLLERLYKPVLRPDVDTPR